MIFIIGSDKGSNRLNNPSPFRGCLVIVQTGWWNYVRNWFWLVELWPVELWPATLPSNRYPSRILIAFQTADYDIIVFSETWLDQWVKNEILHEQYNMFRKDRCETSISRVAGHGGGVNQNHINASYFHLLSINSIHGKYRNIS